MGLRANRRAAKMKETAMKVNPRTGPNPAAPDWSAVVSPGRPPPSASGPECGRY